MKTFVIETGNNEGDYILALFFLDIKGRLAPLFRKTRAIYEMQC